MKNGIVIEMKNGVAHRITLEDGTEIPGITHVHVDIPGGRKPAIATLTTTCPVQFVGPLAACLTEEGARFFQILVDEWKAQEEARKRSEGPTA